MQQGDQEFREENPLTENIIGACIETHRRLGPGLLESVYEECLSYELALRDLSFQRQVPIRVAYRDRILECGYRADIIVEDRVVLELKSVEELLPVHKAQLITYLRLGGYPIGLLVNFNVTSLRQGLRRFESHKNPPRAP